jgi:1-phosphofructokinase
MSVVNNGAPIVTLTPAPTLDRTYYVSNLIEGGVNRADGVAEELAGKGINVTKGLILAGIDAPGVIPIGNADPGVLDRTGHAKTLIPLWIDGTLRVSTTMVIHNGATTKVNEAPRPLSEEDWAAVVELTIKTVRENGAKWLVIAGALPVYKSSGEYVDLQPIFDAMKKMDVRVALDTSGEPLQFWARKGAANIMKPNAEELASAVGRTLNTVGDVIDAARELCAHGVECVLASLGADGMVAVTSEHAWAARTPPVKVINTVGAGDATLAGFLSAVVSNPVVEGDNHFGVGFDVPHGVSAAVQWGAVAVTQATSGLENLDHMPPAILTDNPDRNALLEEPAVG